MIFFKGVGMSNHKKKILIFGATGEIGSRIARGCVGEGYKVTGATRGQNTQHRVKTNGVEFIHGDKGDEDFIKSLAKKDFDVVIDTVPQTEHVKLVYNYFNNRIEHYFICSSTGTFVPLRYIPADENHPWREETYVNFYWQSKRDAYALELWKEHNLPVTIFRPTNIIGPGRIPLELWGGRSILYFKRVKENRSVEIPVNGNILLQSGYNEDLADAFVKAVSKGEEISGEIFIISCKKAITLNRYFNVTKQVLKSTSQAEYVSTEEILRRHPNETTVKDLQFLIEHMCFDISKAEEMLGYSPKYSAEEGLIEALKWCLDEGLL